MKADTTPVLSAFRSDRHPAAYLAFAVFILVLPLLLAHRIPPESIYAAVPSECGDFPYLYRQTYKETSDIDILFCGASTIWKDINTPLVQAALSKEKGSPANVLTVAHAWSGEDATFFLLRDLVARRRIKLAVLQCPTCVVDTSDWPHRMSDYWFTMDDWSMLEGQPVSRRISMYCEQVLGGLRKVLSLVRPDRLETLKRNCCPTLGAMVESRGWSPDGPANTPMAPFKPAPCVVSAGEMFYSTNPGAFQFGGGEPLRVYETQYMKRIVKLFRQHGVPVVLLHMPSPLDQPKDRIAEHTDWRTLFGAPIDILGVPTGRLLEHVTPQQSKLLFYDTMHLNANGNRYFTETILPGILHAYNDVTSAGKPGVHQ